MLKCGMCFKFVEFQTIRNKYVWTSLNQYKERLILKLKCSAGQRIIGEWKTFPRTAKRSKITIIVNLTK